MKKIEAKFAKPKKKVKRSTLVNKADKLFSLIVRRVGECELAGKDNINCGGVLQCAHITTRGRKVLRWDLNNAICICSGHHIWYTKNPNAWAEIIADEFTDKWKYVGEHSNDIWDKDLEKVLEKLLALNG